MEENLIACPIDNKNLVEDAFEDVPEIFGNFYEGNGHREGGKRHLVGFVKIKDKEYPKCTNAEGYVDAKWHYGSNKVFIEILATNIFIDTFEEQKRYIFDYYKEQFKSWENEDNIGLRVKFSESGAVLTASFYTDMSDENL